MGDLDPVGLGDELMTAVAVLRRLVRGRLHADLPGPRLRGGQIELLRLVADRPGIGVAAAARQLYLAPNSVSTLVNQLTDAGLLVRETDPDDRRAVRLRVTEAATARLDNWRQARAALVGAGMATLSEADRGRVAEALPVLHTLINRLAGEEDETE